MNRRTLSTAKHALLRTLLAVVSAAAAVALVAAPAAAQEDPYNSTPRIAVHDPGVCPGDSVTTTVSDGLPGETATVSVAGQSHSLSLDGSGAASVVLSTAGMTPGEYVVSVTASTGATDTAPLFVIDENCGGNSPPPPPADLTISGSDVCVGETLVATVGGAGSGDSITVSLNGTSVTVNANDTGTAQAALPTTSTGAGQYALLATSVSGRGASTPVNLLDEECTDSEILGQGVATGNSNSPQGVSSDVAGGNTSVGSLAATGATIGATIAVGSALVILGVLFVRRSRRSLSS